MSKISEQKKDKSANRSRIACVVFNAAAAMGISDREAVDKLTSQVIVRLERSVTLPGMESLVPQAYISLPPASDADILAMVKEFLSTEQPTESNMKEMSEDMFSDQVIPPITQPEVKKEAKAMPAKTKATAMTAAISENALRVLEKRYLRKDKQGNVVETPQDMFRRVAQAIALAETNFDPKADVLGWEEKYYAVMANLEFLPNSPTLMNAGKELGQLSACFVLPIGDSIESIFDSVKHTALIHKSGGGTGFSFSRLRPESDRVGSTGGVASGPVSFMRAFDVATDVIKQGGTRRGANMAILDVTHPDIMRFIQSKEDLCSLTNFNISVAATDQFMQAVISGDDYVLVNPHTGETAGHLVAREVFNKMAELAWKTGDPGIVFIDRINQKNPTPNLGRIESTNPCGEQPLLPYESCNLGSINLSRMLMAVNGGGMALDYDKLRDTVRLAVRFLDNVIEVNKFPLPQIEEVTKKTRKIGLGVMGFADMLIQLGIPYNSDEALKTAEGVMSFINHEAHQSSVELASERGTFPAYEGSIYDKPEGVLMRNASLTTIAPTGTLSIIAGCSSGIEPLFGLVFVRYILNGRRLLEVNTDFVHIARTGGFYSEDLMQKLAGGSSLADIGGVPEKYRQLFVTAHDISVEWHIKMQAAFQRHVDNAVSKTVNFPKEATTDDVSRVYMMAYQEGLKGITIYRDGSRVGQVLTTGTAATPPAETPKAITPTPRRRSRVTTGATERMTTGCGYIYITVNSDDTGICEVFSHLGKTGGCAAAQLESTCRLISLALRSGIGVTAVVKQLKGIRCPSIAWEDGKSVLSCADAIAGVLERQAGLVQGDNEGKPTTDFGLVKNVAGQCPECTSLLAYEEGCLKCPGCGYTKC